MIQLGEAHSGIRGSTDQLGLKPVVTRSRVELWRRFFTCFVNDTSSSGKVTEARLSYIIVAMALPTTDRRREVRRLVRRLHLRTVCKIVVSVCLLWHIYAVALWNLPSANPLTSTRISDDPDGAQSTWSPREFMQGWGMFAPGPLLPRRLRRGPGSLYRRHQFARGSTFPRMAKMSTWERRTGRNVGGSTSEVAHQDAYNFLWPVMARCARVRTTSIPTIRQSLSP